MNDSNRDDVTPVHPGSPLAPTETPTAAHPERIGRYRIEGVLGRGGFGLVYLAYDEPLERRVAIKVPHARLVAQPEEAAAYLAEARAVANLDHPHIVPVFDVGSTGDCPCYIVSKYIEGTVLAAKLRGHRLDYRDAAELAATVASALHHAHKQGLVHRDVKPGNILIDGGGKPFLVDFGLALREENLGKGPNYVGTPAYMSPEQARGEGHRVDGRSDIFSLGVVLYESLVGRPPFRGDTPRELCEQITRCEARPLRQFDEKLPKELERICHKALAKRASDRYSTAYDMAEDLRLFLQEATVVSRETLPSGTAALRAATCPPPPAGAGSSPASAAPGGTGSHSQPVRIVPKGLRSFEAEDAEFFLELVPGPRNRDGLPDNVRFWKTRIEAADGDQTFSVGLIYGPSGCGKSSLVKAGLLPRLSEQVIPVYVETTPDETESRLLRGLRKRCPGLEENLSLKESLAALRRGTGIPAGRKVLIILDQFEQWLHTHQEGEGAELVQALRQCDGGRVQCIVLVRDDFWLAVSRFLRDVEVRLVEGHNSALTDLFDLDHARKVLACFGRAFGRLPEQNREMTEEQHDFLSQSVRGLADEGKVICVRLALFAEMMRGTNWTPATLQEVGGTTGVGVAFLEKTFSAATAPPAHRFHQQAARAVLKSLLPASGADIKGTMRSVAELREVSGYGSRLQDFDELIRILDIELRLITPTDPEGRQFDEHPATLPLTGQKYYQLTHDYLVHSLRDWLTRKQKETRRGRAELKLAEVSATWNARPQNRFLPTFSEWAHIRLLTDKSHWTEPQRKMMNKAGRVIGLYGGLACTSVALLLLFGWLVAERVEDRQNASYAKALVQSLSAANTADVEQLATEISKYRTWALPMLKEIVADHRSSPTAILHARLVLVRTDPSQVEVLLPQLLAASPDDVAVIVSSLESHHQHLNEPLWDTLRGGANSQRIRAAAALARYDAGDERWVQAREDAVTALVSVPAAESDEWIEMLRPVGPTLAIPLAQRFQDRGGFRRDERLIAAAALSVYLEDQPQRLWPLILLTDDEREFQPLSAALRRHRPAVVSELQVLLSQSPPGQTAPGTWTAAAARDAFWKKQANAAVCLLELGETASVWPLLRQTPDPSLRSLIIDRLARLGASADLLGDRLREEPDPASRYALILALGQVNPQNLPSRRRALFVQQLVNLYREDPDAGVHSAAGWALRNWRQNPLADRIDEELRQVPRQERAWFVNSQGQIFAMIQGPVKFLKGEKTTNLEPKRVILPHRFAMATQEVTVEHFQAFNQEHKHDPRYATQPDCPVNLVTWFDCVAYCNWLNRQEGVPEDQWCYQPNDQGEYAEGMKIAADFLSRAGYRLPTDDEWEFMCRSGTAGTYGFGELGELLRQYAWYMENSESHMWPVGQKLPNRFGAFDMHGNASEWCHNLFSLPAGQTDMQVTVSKHRVIRGGSLATLPGEVRSALRFGSRPDTRYLLTTGFRLARTIP